MEKSGLSSGRKKLKVDLTELEDKKELLFGLLNKSINGKVTLGGHDVVVDSEGLSALELKGMVNKFIYHQHLNNIYWVELEGTDVTIHKFKEKEKKKRKKPTVPPATIKHGWL